MERKAPGARRAQVLVPGGPAVLPKRLGHVILQRQFRKTERARVHNLRVVEDGDREAVDVGRPRQCLDAFGHRSRVDGGAVEPRDSATGD